MEHLHELFITLRLLGRMCIVAVGDGRILPLVQGGADDGEPTPIPEDLSALDETAARELWAKLGEQIAAKRSEAKSLEQVAELRQLREAQNKVAGRVTEIVNEQTEIQQGLAEIDAEVPPLPEAPATGDGANATGDGAVVAPTGNADAKPAADAPAAQAAGATGDTATGITAGISPADIAAGRDTQTAATVAAAAARPARPRVSYVAAAGQTEIQAGTVVDYERIGQMLDSAKGLDGSKGYVVAHVASLPAFEDMADLRPLALSRSLGVEATDRMIRESVDDWRLRPENHDRLSARDKARLAALGRTAAICDPLDILRDIPDTSMDADPLGDSLPSRPAGRLGFQFTQAISLSAVSSGVTAGWDEALQAAVDVTDMTTWKPCVDIDCPNPENIRAEEVVACARFDVTTDMSNPERVQDALSKMAALRVRLRTQHLLAKADALSSAYTFESEYGYGAFPALVEASMSVVARAIYAERLDPASYNLYLPPGLVEALVTDLVGRAYQDTEALRQAAAEVVRVAEAVTGLRTIRLWDVVGANPFAALNPPGEAAIPLPPLACAGDQDFQLRFIAPADALYFSTGEEKTGLESSPELLRQNKVQFFSREWVGLAKHGSSPWFTVAASVAANGARTGLNEPVPCG